MWFFIKICEFDSIIIQLIFFISVDCVWGVWESGECSKECGGGTRTNKRDRIQEELFGGNPCNGNSTFEENCNLQECPGTFKI